MAFVSRSKRQTVGLTEQKAGATNPLVGPGSYLNIDKFNTDIGYAPFNCTAERGLNSHNIVDGKPGPGFYEKDVISRTNKQHATNNAFVSRVTRFAKENVTKQTPGPGTYVESNKWLKNTHKRYSAGQGNGQPVQNTPHIVFAKQTTAPSVPARNQCYGYEVGDEGELVRQAAPGGQYQGVATDAVGPADYRPQFTLQHRHRQTDFSRSNTKREIFKPKKTPGPGQYNEPVPTSEAMAAAAAESEKSSAEEESTTLGAPSSNANTNAAMRRLKKTFAPSKSSNFASKVPRMPGEKAENQTPGPGSYAHAQAIHAQNRKNGSTTQLFGSTAKRSYEVDKERQHAAPTFATTPGPGSYEVHMMHTLKTVQQVSLVEPAPFASSSLRFGSDDKAMPGPGAYYNESGEGFVGELSRKIVARNGAFGCSTHRFVSTKSSSSYLYMGNDDSPGPGQYIPDMPFKIQKGNQKKSTSSFSSKVHRFKPNKEPKKKNDQEDDSISGKVADGGHSTPPPGAYSTVDPWDWAKKSYRSGSGSKAFISKAKRFQESEKMKKQLSDPGPGSYDTGKDMLKQTRKKVNIMGMDENCFVSSAPRFNHMSTLAPGPGTYQTEDPETTMIKRSFNVTIDGVE